MPDTRAAARAAQLLAERFGAAPITTGQALSVVSARALRTAATRGTVTRVHRGVYVVTRERTDLARFRDRIAAALATRTGAVASHESALALHGMSLPGFGDTWDRHPVRLSVQRGERRRRANLRISRRHLPCEHQRITPWGPATTPVRTALDLARELPFPVALVVADEACAAALVARAHPDVEGAAVRGRPGFRDLVTGQGLAARDLLLRADGEAPWQRGCAGIRHVAEWVDPASESPGESVSRAHLVSAGLPRPVVGLQVVGDDGRTYYADMAWPNLSVLAEVDGYGKYRADAWSAFRREKQREDALRAAGWTVVRWTVVEMLRDPHTVVRRVRRALDRQR